MDRLQCPTCAQLGQSDESGQDATSMLFPRVSADHDYVACQRCGLAGLDPMPTLGGGESYDRGYFVDGGPRAGYADYAADELWHRRTANQRLDRLAQLPDFEPDSGPPRIIDVGTALGYLPDEARRRGWAAAAVEHSAWAAEQARGLGLRVESDLADLADVAPVDAVTFFQVLEHLPNPVDAIRDAARLLRPGGYLVCETWDRSSRTARLMRGRWQQLSPPSVLWLFDADSARTMVVSVGLMPISWKVTGKEVSLATVSAQASPASLAGLVRRVAPLTRAIPVPYRLDDLVTFVAQVPYAGGPVGP